MLKVKEAADHNKSASAAGALLFIARIDLPIINFSRNISRL